MMKKTLCLLLALALCLPLLPASALAADGMAGEDRQLYFCRSGDEADRLTALRFAPRESISGFFCIIPDGETLQRIDSGVAYTPDEGSAENALTLFLAGEAENATSSFVWFNTFGTGRLVYTDETGVRYSMAAACALPDRGFSTAATLTEETYLPNDAYCPKDLSFYYVFPEGTVVTGVSAVAAHGDEPIPVQAEVLSDPSHVCRFTLTSDLFSNGVFALEVSFTLQGSDTPATAFISVRDPAPRFGFRLYQRSGSFSENLFRSVETDAGYRNRLGFFLSSGDDSSLLDLASVTFLPAEGVDAGAMTATKLANGIWQLDSVLPGQGTLQCTAQDRTVYTLPVVIALPSPGFFSERRMATETYLPRYDFDETKTEHVVWFLTAKGFSAGDITGWAGRDRLDAPVTLEAHLQAELVAREDDSGRYDIKLTVQDIPGCHLTVWPELPDGGHMELEIINTKKLASLTPLDAPTGLAWAGDYPGNIRCKSGALFQDHLLWALYQVGNPAPLALREMTYSGHYDPPDSWRIDDLFWAAYHPYPDRESGDYYFTVQAVGDEEQYKDSPVATSPIWHYERPEAALAAPTDLHWEGQTACWSDEVNRAADLYGYLIQFRCKDPETGKAVFTYDYDMYDIESLAFSGLKDTLDDQILERLGSGTCQFRIQALSRDITRIRHGQWSEFNEVGTQLTAPSTVADALNQLLTDYTPSEGAKLTEEQATALKSAVAAKKDELERTLFSGADSSNGVAGKLQALEALVGGPASVTVTENAPAAIAQSGVSIVGASLNGAAGSTVSLKIDKAQEVSAETPINPAQYHNTIPFSMTLAGVSEEQQHQRLAVPVLITLPLPGSIRPSFLVLLHKTEAGWHEIFPYQILYNDELKQYCVRFTVTSFSDFAFAQQLFCGIERLWPALGQLTVCATADVKKVVAAVYDGSGKQLGCAASAIENGGTLTLNLPALKTGAAVRVFFLNETGQPACPAAARTISR